MAYQPLEELLPRASMGVYRLSRLASKRALEISATGSSLLEKSGEQKLATIALEEIRAGKVMDKETSEIFDAANKAAKKKANGAKG